MRKASLFSYMLDVFKGIWERWDLRGLMLLSLLLQILLLVLSPLRKWHSKNWVLGSILCLYLVADWAANYAASVIISSSSVTTKHKLPLALWSAFLLVHLGGPDSITAFALQDNDFWHRHALALGVQCFSATYVFFRTLAENHLWLPTLLVFACGFIKYLERTRCLYLACFNNLRDSIRRRPDAGPNYAKLMGLHDSMEKARLPTSFQRIEVPPRVPFRVEHDLSERETLLYAHRFFSVFKRLVVDLKCSHVERRLSRNFFRRRTAEEAFRIIALELNFMYEMLFTKANLVNKRLLRLLTTSLVAAALGLFYLEEKRFGGSDVAITYALLAGAIAMDATYWYSAFSFGAPGPLLLPRDSKPHGRLKMFYEGWSETVSTHNLIDYCLDLPKAETQRIMEWFGVSSYFEGLWYVKPHKFTPMLKDHIFTEVKKRSELAGGHGILHDTVITARGSFALRSSSMDDSSNPLLRYVDEMDYDQSLLSWHIATDILFSRDEKMKGCKTGSLSSKDDQKEEYHGGDHDLSLNQQRLVSKLLSEYMMYLVAMQPAIMYGFTDMGQTRLLDTRAEVMVAAGTVRENLNTITVIRYALVNCCEYLLTPIILAALNLRVLIFRAGRYRTVQSAFVVCCIFLLLLIIGLLSPITYFVLSLFVVVLLPLLPRDRLGEIETRLCSSDRQRADERSRVIDSIYHINTSIPPFSIKGDQSQSVLFDGCQLAKELDRLKGQKWEIMSRVWVEMLTYAAVRCRPQPLAERLSKGGELISFVWLLMAHFGLMDQFEGKEREFITKIIVEK